MIPSWYPPRGGGFFRAHSNALAEMGLNTHVLAAIETGLRDDPVKYFSSSNTYSSRYKHILEHRKLFRRFPFLERKNVYRWVGHVVEMYEKHCNKHGHPALLQAHSSMWGGLAAARIHAKHGIPYVITEHRGRFTGIGKQAKELIKDWHIPLLEEALKHATRIVCVSHALTKMIREIYPDSLHKLKVIPNMVDTGFFIPANRDTGSGDPFNFICIANLSQEKGIDVLLEAFALLQKSSKIRTNLTIGGDGPYRQKLIRQATRLGIVDKVIFTGSLSQSEILEKLQQSQSFVSSSHFESFGIVIIEAMACGIPVIATRSGGPAEIITNSNGLLCDPGQPEMLASTMQKMMLIHKQFDKQSIRDFCVQHFSKKTITDSYLRLYHQILQP